MADWYDIPDNILPGWYYDFTSGTMADSPNEGGQTRISRDDFQTRYGVDLSPYKRQTSAQINLTPDGTRPAGFTELMGLGAPGYAGYHYDSTDPAMQDKYREAVATGSYLDADGRLWTPGSTIQGNGGKFEYHQITPYDTGDGWNGRDMQTGGWLSEGPTFAGGGYSANLRGNPQNIRNWNWISENGAAADYQALQNAGVYDPGIDKGDGWARGLSTLASAYGPMVGAAVAAPAAGLSGTVSGGLTAAGMSPALANTAAPILVNMGTQASLGALSNYENPGMGAASGALGGLIGGIGQPLGDNASSYLSQYMSQGLSNGLSGFLTNAGGNALSQYALTGSVNPLSAGTAGLMGGVKGYMGTPNAPDSDSAYAEAYGQSGLSAGAQMPDNYTMQPSRGLGDGSANGGYDLRGESLSLTGNDSGLRAPGLDSSYNTNIGYDAGRPEYSLMSESNGLNLNGEQKQDYGKYAKALTNALSGLLASEPLGFRPSAPVTAPNFAQLATKRANQGALAGESQTLFPWLRTTTTGEASPETNYPSDYRQESKGLMEQQMATPSKAAAPKEKKPSKREKDNISKGIWQAYA